MLTLEVNRDTNKPQARKKNFRLKMGMELNRQASQIWVEQTVLPVQVA